MKQLELEAPARRRAIVEEWTAEAWERLEAAHAAGWSQGMIINGVFNYYTDWRQLPYPTLNGWYQVMVTEFTKSLLWWDENTQCFYQDAALNSQIIVPPSVTRPWRGLTAPPTGGYPCDYGSAGWDQLPAVKSSTRRVILEN